MAQTIDGGRTQDLVGEGFDPFRDFQVRDHEVQYQDIVYSCIRTSFTLSGMIFSDSKGGNHGLEGNDSDGAEDRVHYRMAIRSILNHRTMPSIWNFASHGL